MKIIHTGNAPAAVGPYSQAIISGGLVYTSGQIPLSPESGELVGKDIRSQCEQVIRNLSAVLKVAGAGLDTVIKTTCFITDMADFAAFNEVYAKYLVRNPARSCIEVKGLPKGALVEIEAVALCDG